MFAIFIVYKFIQYWQQHLYQPPLSPHFPRKNRAPDLSGASVGEDGKAGSVCWHPGILKSNSRTVKQHADICFSVDLAHLL